MAIALYAADQQTTKPQATAAKPAAATPAAVPAQGPRPEQFLGKFPPLDFKPPKAADFRTTLSNGLVVYIAEDHEIPWFEATLLTPGGRRRRRRRPGARAWTATAVSFPQRRRRRRRRRALVPRAQRQARSPGHLRLGDAVRRDDDDDRRPDQRADGVPGRQRVPDVGVDPHAPRGRGAQDLARHPPNPAFPEDRIKREKDSMAAPLRNRNRNLTGRRQHDVGEADVRRGLAHHGRGHRDDDQQHHARRRRGVAQEVLGIEQRHPRRDRTTSRRPRCWRSSRRRSASGAPPRPRRHRTGRRSRASRPSRASTWCSRSARRRTRASSASAPSA